MKSRGRWKCHDRQMNLMELPSEIKLWEQCSKEVIINVLRALPIYFDFPYSTLYIIQLYRVILMK